MYRFRQRCLRHFGRTVRGFAAPVTSLLASVVLTLSCSLLVRQDATQCQADSDCAKFPGTICVQGGCVVGSPPIDAGVRDTVLDEVACTSTQDCIASIGPFFVCRAGACLRLKSPDCGLVYGAYKSDTSLLLGAIIPLGTPYKTTGGPILDAMQLALSDFEAGVPSGHDGVPRSVAFVVCDETVDPQRAARHLVEDLHVPAILGPTLSATTLSVQPVVPTTLLMSPYATSDLSSIDVAGLVYRTAPADDLQAAALRATISKVLEPRLNKAGISKLKLAVVHKSDVDGDELTRKFLDGLTFNGAPYDDPSNDGYFLDLDYGDPDEIPPVINYTDTLATLTTTLPDLIVMIGNTEGVPNVLAKLEDSWPLGAPKPTYLVSSGLLVKELLGTADLFDDLRKRLLVESPGGDRGNPHLKRYFLRYGGTFVDKSVPQTFGAEQAFDATYLLAYAISATRNVDLVGRDMQDALEHILVGTPSVIAAADPDSIANAFTAIRAGGSISFEGTTGLLRFDLATGTAKSDVQLWCIARPAGGKSTFQHAGLSWSSSSASLGGALDPLCQ